MDIGDVYRSVALVASDAATNPHPQGLPSILPNRDCLLRQLRPLNPQSFLEKLRHFRVRMIICTRGRNTSWKWNNGGKFGPTDWEYQWCLTWNWLGDGFAVLLVVWAWLGSVSLLVSRYLRLRLAVGRHRVAAVDVERLQGSIRRFELLHAGTPCLHLLHLLPLPVDGLVDGHVVFALRQIVEGLIYHAVRAPVVEVVVPDRLLASVVVHLVATVAIGSQVVRLAQGVAVRVPRSGGGRGLGPGVTHLDTCKVENRISLSEIGKTNFPPGWLCGPGCASWQSASSSSPEIVEDWAELFFLATTSTTFSLFWANW